MPTEIERKFLVEKSIWQKVEKNSGELYRQGYLLTDPNKTIRVRQTSEKGFITIKGLSVGATRPEFEYEIPFDDAKELLNQFAISELSKIRYKIIFEDKLWEVDEFLGDNLGLIVAEIELKSEDISFALPDWIDREVTSEQKYYNSNLTILPFKYWES
ncbi:CYTH domain-containing protein [Halpernia humi]|uniref:CYTH domain-containing protein n=1 Tax=Halpernia humi TaxID=493375 RepID=A0A1H5TX00_9FLAO|nr:CYTH domain-containing protein [Halpernia humi]SEF67260.1 CYTH domain-containing protein [Halpernia humi]